MPIKKIPNHVSLRSGETLSVVSANKKAHFDSESKLFDSLQSAIRAINVNYTVYLSTHPYVAVHVQFGRFNELLKDKGKIEQAVQGAMEMHLKET